MKKIYLLGLFVGVIGIFAVINSKKINLNQRVVSSVDAKAPQCPRELVGGELKNAPDLFSKDGILEVSLEYRSYKTDDDLQYCYLMSNGQQSPTFHVKPGDRLKIHVKNNSADAKTVQQLGELRIDLPVKDRCASPYIDSTSMNMHFHGTNTPPTCGSDEVINTVINAGDSFTYDLPIPLDEPPGTYYYHPHIHGKAQEAAWGGATGVIVVDGLQNYFPELVGMNDRIFTVRDNVGVSDEKLEQMGLKKENESSEVPSFEISLNYHPISFPQYVTPFLKVQPQTKELWRVANTSADVILNLKLDYDGEAQDLQIYAIDGVPVSRHGGVAFAKPIVRKSFLLAPGNRVEFVVNTPSLAVKNAQLMTEAYDTGADIDPARPLLKVVSNPNSTAALKVPAVSSNVRSNRFSRMMNSTIGEFFGKKRKIYFAQKDVTDPNDATKETTEFYITVDGKKDEVFNMKRPVDIVTHENAVEVWTIENRAEEAHVFHIHQIHFLLTERDGVSTKGDDRQIYDTIIIPKYDGKKDSSGRPVYPSVKLRMDFSETKPGIFVYHCHILEHEDKGMMGIIQVLPKRSNVNETTNY